MISDNLHYLKQHPYISSNISLEIYDHPFPHIIINDMFASDIYDMICSNFEDMISRTKPYKDLPGAVHGYSAHIYGLKRSDCKYGYDFFVDNVWKNFNMMTFGILLNKYIAVSAHWHQAPAEPGFIHNDFNICSVMEDGEKDYTLTGNCYYSDDTDQRNPEAVKMVRSIAGLYYFNNNPQKENDGGTSIYTNYKFFSKVKGVPAKNNSMFLFAVQPNSYHGFSGASFNRSAIVQWFHSSPAYITHKYKDMMYKKHKKYGSAFERWQPKEAIWDIRKDPEYKKYFGSKKKSLEELLTDG